MIIVSQDKNAIINFDNINEIRVTNTKDIIMFDNTYRSSDDCSDKLGTYETEERAKEVLREIIRKYESSTAKLGKNYISLEYEFVYKMPEE